MEPVWSPDMQCSYLWQQLLTVRHGAQATIRKCYSSFHKSGSYPDFNRYLCFMKTSLAISPTESVTGLLLPTLNEAHFGSFALAG
uniref:Uncharacterized protein n=1 Tax=Dicentrarchus labrax TaxID=13489 RepID=A0A8C4DEG2_DICLA